MQVNNFTADLAELLCPLVKDLFLDRYVIKSTAFLAALTGLEFNAVNDKVTITAEAPAIKNRFFILFLPY